MISFQQTGCIQPTGRAPESDSSERKRSPSAEDPLPAVSCPFMGPILKGLDRPPPTSGSEAVRGSVLQKRYTAGLWRVSAGGAARPQVALGLRAVGPERRGQCRFGARELADKLAPSRGSSQTFIRSLIVGSRCPSVGPLEDSLSSFQLGLDRQTGRSPPGAAPRLGATPATSQFTWSQW
jgi:hypothetical protein